MLVSLPNSVTSFTTSPDELYIFIVIKVDSMLLELNWTLDPFSILSLFLSLSSSLTNFIENALLSPFSFCKVLLVLFGYTSILLFSIEDLIFILPDFLPTLPQLSSTIYVIL